MVAESSAHDRPEGGEVMGAQRKRLWGSTGSGLIEVFILVECACIDPESRRRRAALSPQLQNPTAAAPATKA